MDNITRTQIEDFLEQKGYQINKKMFSELENGIYDCWFKPGAGKIKVIKERRWLKNDSCLCHASATWIL